MPQASCVISAVHKATQKGHSRDQAVDGRAVPLIGSVLHTGPWGHTQGSGSEAHQFTDSVSGCINRSIVSRMREVAVLPCSALLRTHLKACAQFLGSSVGGMDRADGYSQRRASADPGEERKAPASSGLRVAVQVLTEGLVQTTLEAPEGRNILALDKSFFLFCSVFKQCE